MARPEMVHQDQTLRIGIARNLLICVWTNTPEASHVRLMGRAMSTMSSRHQHRWAFLDVVASGTPKFSDTVRDEVVRLMRDGRLQGRSAAHVILLPGFAGITMRAFLSTVMLLGRPSSVNKVFGDLRSAADWIAPLLQEDGESWSAEAVLAAEAEVARAGVAKAGS